MTPFRAPTHKFYGEQGPRHGGRLVWPGLNGYPIRTEYSVALLSAEERNSLPLVADCFARTFCTSNSEDLEYYLWVRERARLGWFTIDYEERHWDDQNKTMWVYLEWSQIYYTVPSQLVNNLSRKTQIT